VGDRTRAALHPCRRVTAAMTESERIETLIERLESRKGSYQWGQKIQQWLHVEERDLIVKALEHYKLSINGNQRTDDG
jgi:hypothetical protein